MTNNKRILLAILFCLFLFRPAAALAVDGITLSNEYILDVKDGGNKTYNDKSVRIDYKQIYLTGYLGDFHSGAEVGGYLKDVRRSAYSGYIRFRDIDQAYVISTEQVLKYGFVGRLEFRYIHLYVTEPADNRHNLFVYGFGFDKYYGDYSFFTVQYYNDPRHYSDPSKNNAWSVIISNTFATQDSFLRLGIVPRSNGRPGYFGLVKYHWLFAGYAFTKEFDFSTLDRRSVTFGLQVPFDLKWSRPTE